SSSSRRRARFCGARCCSGDFDIAFEIYIAFKVDIDIDIDLRAKTKKRKSEKCKKSKSEHVEEHARASACGAVTSHAADDPASSLRSRFLGGPSSVCHRPTP